MEIVFGLASSFMKSGQAWLVDNGVGVILTIIMAIILYFVGAWFLAKLTRNIVIGAHSRTWNKKDVDKRQKTVTGLIVNIWRVIVVIVTFFTLLLQIVPNINLTPLFASAGIIGVALGFGAQSIVRDFLSGVFIIAENQYRVGDIIEVGEASGTVERIGVRTTILRDMNGNVHFFPNGTVAHVVNQTMGYSVARFTISVKPSTDLDKVIAQINDVGRILSQDEKWNKKVLEPPHFVSLDDLTSDSADLVVAGKVQPSDQWAVVSEMRRRLLEDFEKEKIDLAG